MNFINLLPENGIPNDLHEIDDSYENQSNNDEGPEVLENDFDTDNVDNFFQEAFIESEINKELQSQLIEKAINFPKASIIPINEYECGAICSLLFPKLFPMGKADPTKKSIRNIFLKSVSLIFIFFIRSKKRNY